MSNQYSSKLVVLHDKYRSEGLETLQFKSSQGSCSPFCCAGMASRQHDLDIVEIWKNLKWFKLEQDGEFSSRSARLLDIEGGELGVLELLHTDTNTGTRTVQVFGEYFSFKVRLRLQRLYS